LKNKKVDVFWHAVYNSILTWPRTPDGWRILRSRVGRRKLTWAPYCKSSRTSAQSQFSQYVRYSTNADNDGPTYENWRLEKFGSAPAINNISMIVFWYFILDVDAASCNTAEQAVS